GLRTDKVTSHNYELTGGLKGNLGEFGDYFKTWNWETGFRYNEDQRLYLFGGVVNNNTLRAALLDTDPATAFNPFGLNRNSPAVIDKIFVTPHRLGTNSLILEDLKLYGDVWHLPAGPIAFAVGSEHRTERETDQPDSLLVSGQTTGAINFPPAPSSQVHETVFVPDPAGLTPHNAVEATIGGNPNLNAEQAYEWTYGAAWTPAKFIKGLTLSADFYHIDLRNTAFGYDIASLITRNFVTRTGTLPNGAPTGGVWSDLIQRDPVTGAILSVNTLEQNVTRLWNEGLDYEATYQL